MAIHNDKRLTPLNLGVAPDDWFEAFMGDVTSKLTNGFVGQSLTHQVSREEGVLYLQGFNVRENRIEQKKVTFVSESFHAKQKKSHLLEGDLLTVQSGHIGTTAVVTADLENSNCHALIISRLNPDKLDPSFVAYYINSEIGQARLRGLHVGSTILHINTSEFGKFLIPLPPLPEQKKIAEILGACDEAIEAQERLIAQKQQRKKGLMQKLLTGKTRFPQFAGMPWREVRLGDVGSVTGAGVDKKSNPEEVPVRLVNYMDVYRNPFISSGLLDHAVTAPEKKANQCSTKKGDVFFTPSSEKPTDIANSAVALEDIPDAVYSYHVVRLRLKEDWDLQFRAYAFTTDKFMRQAERICEGSGTRYVISLEDFRGIKVSVPSKEEQSAISSVLSACDEELTLQQNKLEQLKQQKKGLMQQLLTGKVRVEV